MKVLSSSAFSECLLLINPSRYPQYIKILERILRRSSFSRIIISENRGHFIRCAENFISDPEKYLLVWGGDGTAHAAVNALVRTASAVGTPEPCCGGKAIGFLRGGSGNGIQDSYEVPFSLKGQLEAYAESVLNHYTEPVDLIKIRYGNKEIFGQLMGLGFDAQVLKRRESYRKKRGAYKGHPKPGLFNYARAGIAVFFGDLSYRNQNFSVRMTEGKYAFRGYRVNAEFPFDFLERNTQLPMFEAGTRPYYGKLFKVCPDVVCNDGVMDIYIFNFQERHGIIRNLIPLWQGNHSVINKRLTRKNKPVIERYETRECLLLSDEPIVFHVDGELIIHDTRSSIPGNEDKSSYGIHLTIVPSGINFLVPGSFYRKFHPFSAGEAHAVTSHGENPPN